MTDIDSTDSASPGMSDEPVAPRKRHLKIVAAVAGALLTVVAGVVVSDLLFRNRTPLLTQEQYEEAAQRWDARGPASYQLELELLGNRPGHIEVEVRNGRAVRMVRDGVQPSQQRTWYYWTVPGMMDMIAEELEMAADPAEAFRSPQAAQMLIRAKFDPTYGYPTQYDRVVLGTDFEIQWRVLRFTPLDAE